jgi:hypothetical protein
MAGPLRCRTPISVPLESFHRHKDHVVRRPYINGVGCTVRQIAARYSRGVLAAGCTALAVTNCSGDQQVEGLLSVVEVLP